MRNICTPRALRCGLNAVFCTFALPCLSLTARAADGDLGNGNTAEGRGALTSLTTGGNNTAVGFQALNSTTTGIENTALGAQALPLNTGDSNTATGFQALSSNTTGAANTATGVVALLNNTAGFSNTADGFEALYSNTGGYFNTACGAATLPSNTTGISNTAIGVEALQRNTTGIDNIGVGGFAGANLTTGSFNIDIGNPGNARESNTIRIGKPLKHKNTFIAGISGVTVAGGVSVIIDTSGHLGTVQSSARFKHNIKPMDKASEAILALKPVTFHYKEELDPDGIPQFGLVAEDVEKIAPELVARDEEGNPYSVRYGAVNAMLLNEFLKEHQKVEAQQRNAQEQETRLSKQERIIAEQGKKIDALTKGLRRVTEQLGVSEPRSVDIELSSGSLE